MRKKLKLDITLTESQTDLLRRLAADNGEGFDDWACEHSCNEEDPENDDMIELIELGLAESILGEQFFITDLGLKFLRA